MIMRAGNNLKCNIPFLHIDLDADSYSTAATLPLDIVPNNRKTPYSYLLASKEHRMHSYKSQASYLWMWIMRHFHLFIVR